MSTARRGTWGPKGTGPTGRPLCYCGCGREVPKGSRTNATPTCYHNWCKKNDPATQRSMVEKRDNGVCALCHTDTVERAMQAHQTEHLWSWLAIRHAENLLFQGLLPLYPGFTESEKRYAFMRNADSEKIGHYDAEKWAEHWVDEDIRKAFGAYISANGHTWEMDHTIPVCEGGGCCNLDNLRTLCLPCHRKETAKLAARRAAARKQKKALPELLLT